LSPGGLRLGDGAVDAERTRPAIENKAREVWRIDINLVCKQMVAWAARRPEEWRFRTELAAIFLISRPVIVRDLLARGFQRAETSRPR